MKHHLLCLSFFAISACRTGMQSPAEGSIDTITATGVVRPAPAVNTGIWNATIKGSKNKGQHNLIVSGTINVGNASAIANLKKQTSAPVNPHTLILALSHEPRQSKELPVKVRYEEALTATSSYDTIRIMNNSRTVAIITDIRDLR